MAYVFRLFDFRIFFSPFLFLLFFLFAAVIDVPLRLLLLKKIPAKKELCIETGYKGHRNQWVKLTGTSLVPRDLVTLAGQG